MPDDELEQLEEYNKSQNDKLANRPVTNLITCPVCRGSGGYFSRISEPEWHICKNCYGRMYIDLDPYNFRSNINEFMRPFTDEERKKLSDPST